MRNEQDPRAKAIDTRMAKEFPEHGHTLILNGIGRRGTELMKRFASLLRDCGAGGELLGAAAFGVHNSAKRSIETATTQRFSLPFQRPSVIVNDLEGTIKTFDAESKRNGDSARVVLHFYVPHTEDEEIRAGVVSAYERQFPNAQQIAVVAIPDDPLGSLEAQEAMQMYPPDRTGVPAIVIDLRKAKAVKGKSGGIDGQEAFLHGLAGVISAHKQFSKHNPSPYPYIFRRLTLGERLLGASVGIYETVRVKRFGGARYDLVGQEIATDVSHAVVDALKPEGSITPLEKKPESALTVTSVQIPLSPNHPYWRSALVEDARQDMQSTAYHSGIALPEETLYTYGYSSQPTGVKASMIALYLFPAEMPGGNSSDKEKKRRKKVDKLVRTLTRPPRGNRPPAA